MTSFRRRLGPPGACLAFVLAAGAGHAAPKLAGHLEEARGTVVAEAGVAQRALGPAADVFVGDDLATGLDSRAQFRLGRDTSLRLGERTRVHVDHFLVDAGGVISIGGGPVLIDKTEGTGNRPVRLRGAFGLITVRGTRLFVGPSNGVTGVFVDHGRVAVTSGGRTVVVRDGEGTDIGGRGQQPTRPVRWGAPRIVAALASVD